MREAMSGADAAAFVDDPSRFFGYSRWEMQHVPPDELYALQRDGLRLRFEQLRDQVPVLTAMAEEQGIEALDDLGDVVPLLFQHTVYKSFPMSLLEHGNFAMLTRWLDRLTTCDLSGVPVDGCDSIDAWIDALDAHTELRVVHTSGTSGSMSFLPRSLGEYERLVESMRCALFEDVDPKNEQDHSQDFFHVVWPTFRYGRSHILRIADPELLPRYFAGSEERFHALHHRRLSADAMFLAARLRAAAATGDLGKLEISPALRARQQEFAEAQAELADAMPRFFKQIVDELAGERVWVSGTWNVLYDVARAGLERGLQGVFSPESVITTGGGAKGVVLPDDWEQTVHRFVGVDRLHAAYGMAEILAMNSACERGRYHLEPWVVLFVLDPDTGEVLPRTGEQTGRAAFYDLTASTHWGGIITGDEVNVDWRPCACGRTSAHLSKAIERYSEKRGGTDKITCAASDDAHRAVLEYLNEQLA